MLPLGHTLLGMVSICCPFTSSLLTGMWPLADMVMSHPQLCEGKKVLGQNFPAGESGDIDPVCTQESLFRAPKLFYFYPKMLSRCPISMFLYVLCYKFFLKKEAQQWMAEQEDGRRWGCDDLTQPSLRPASSNRQVRVKSSTLLKPSLEYVCFCSYKLAS